VRSPDSGFQQALLADKARVYYTVQAMATSEENRDAFLRIHESLHDKGYLVYYCRARVRDRAYLRLRTGVFPSRSEATAYAGQFRVKEGLDGFVAEADVAVDAFKDRFLVITTPSGIWLKAGASARELYRFGRVKTDIAQSAARISPQDDAIVFHDDNGIMTVAIGTGKVKVLRLGTKEDELLDSVVR